ncbi:hypothetical protein [Leptospira borgpetersenii]|nr:hypothetical protein [Leptospira borgpetersenii]
MRPALSSFQQLEFFFKKADIPDRYDFMRTSIFFRNVIFLN